MYKLGFLFILFFICNSFAEIKSGGTISHESGWYKSGEYINISANPDRFSEFKYWKVNQEYFENNSNILVKIEKPKVIVANFNLLKTTNEIPHIWFFLMNPKWTNNFEELENTDWDGDGFTISEEYFSGTNPNDINSYPHIENVSITNNNIYLKWNHFLLTNQNVYVTVHNSSNLIDWNKTHKQKAKNGKNVFTVEKNQQKVFYRITTTIKRNE